jgi:hypothetical protein
MSSPDVLAPRLPGGRADASILGEWDLVVQLRASSLSEFDLALERILSLTGVKATHTNLLFNSLTTGPRRR